MTSEPRPAFVSVGELFGGVERHLLGMCLWMQRQGREPLLILYHDRELAKQAREIGVEPVILEATRRFDLRAPRRLAEILKNHRINVVHAHGYRAVVNVALARQGHGFQVVRTVHGLAEGQGWFSFEVVKRRLYIRLEQFAARKTNAAVCYVTEDLQKAYAQADRGLNTRTVYNGIDPLHRENFARPADLEEGVYHFGIVGRVTPVKGIEYALQAIGLLDEQSKVVLNIIGTGPSVEFLQAAVKERRLSGRVRFLGFKDNVYDYLAHLDTLLMPSLHEGLPYTILEALSLETPILASRTGGLGEILHDGETALLVDVGDVEGLAVAMAKLANDRELGRKLAACGRKMQNETLNLETMGEQYWREYERVVR